MVGTPERQAVPALPDLTGLENLAIGKPASQSSLSRWSRPNDAQGAVNGRRTGGFGFHTDDEAAAWWRVVHMVDDQDGTYIPRATWLNTPEQREMMPRYPIEGLRLRE
jgi:hypothetical protein